MRSGMILSGVMALLLVGGPGAATTGSATEISCLATGYDVTLYNESEVAIEAGRDVDWRVPFTRTTGRHSLRATFEPGAQINLTGALGSDYLVGDSPCEAALAQESENG